jgi:outer membrane phospholipase A
MTVHRVVGLGIAMVGMPATAAPELLLQSAARAVDGYHVRLLVLNDGAQPVSFQPPARLDAVFRHDGGTTPVGLERAATMPTAVAVAGGGFAVLDYRFAPAADMQGSGSLALAGAGGPMLALDFGPRANPVIAEAPSTIGEAARTLPTQAPPPAADTAVANPFLPNLSAYGPIYGVYGPGTDAEVRLQISFKYQLFGAPESDADRSWARGLHFAYNQRMFWDIGANSSPFRNIDFMPELLYLTPRVAGSAAGWNVTAAVSARHESNGRSGADSRSINMLQVEPRLRLPFDGWSLTVAPRAWVYVGSLSDNPDIGRYRGNSGLGLIVDETDGFRLAVDGRLNFGSGRGAVTGDVSYPVDRLIGSSLNVYLYGQLFRGYGENLLDYRRLFTRARAGIAFVR